MRFGILGSKLYRNTCNHEQKKRRNLGGYGVLELGLVEFRPRALPFLRFVESQWNPKSQDRSLWASVWPTLSGR
jgi:hypothetical protein